MGAVATLRERRRKAQRPRQDHFHSPWNAIGGNSFAEAPNSPSGRRCRKLAFCLLPIKSSSPSFHHAFVQSRRFAEEITVIARVWHGYTKPEHADAYESMLKPEL